LQVDHEPASQINHAIKISDALPTVPVCRLAERMNVTSNAQLEADRKRKIRRARRREAKRLIRDRKIYRLLRFRHDIGMQRARFARLPISPLSVYLPDQRTPKGKFAAQFPVTHQRNGSVMPQWKDLSKWLKVQLAVMVLHSWRLITFNINLHPDIEERMVHNDQNVRKVLMASMGRELRLVSGLKDREFYFVIEGWSKTTRAATGLHVHGAMVVWEDDGEKAVDLVAAVARACGHGVAGRKAPRRAIHAKPFERERPGYVDYLFKATKKGDARLDDRNRLAMSRTAVDGTRHFWEVITGQAEPID
jgi:hypothetical protein